MVRKQKFDPDVADALTKATNFSPALIKTLATVGASVGIPEGWSIIMESTPADSAYIVLEGSVEIRKSKQVIANLGPGDVFGEIALVDHRLRSASVVAGSHVQALRLSGEAIAELLEHDPGFADTLRETSQARISDDDERKS